MRKLYSTTHAGVAVVSTPLRLHQAVDLSDYPGHGILGPVEYLDFDNDGMILPKSFGREARPGLLKHKSFEHENEVRGLIIFMDHSKIPSQFDFSQMIELFRPDSLNGISVNFDLKLLIEEIYISLLAVSYFKDVVKLLVDRHGLTERIRPSTLDIEPVFQISQPSLLNPIATRPWKLANYAMAGAGNN
jgi:hypothetical protein